VYQVSRSNYLNCSKLIVNCKRYKYETEKENEIETEKDRHTYKEKQTYSK
jgi:hypothetical protein